MITIHHSGLLIVSDLWIGRGVTVMRSVDASPDDPDDHQ
jgi:hypothetical protein